MVVAGGRILRSIESNYNVCWHVRIFFTFKMKFLAKHSLALVIIVAVDDWCEATTSRSVKGGGGE